jgi:DNA-binding MarR family transcriptional regulator
MCISESGNIRTFLREYYRMQRQQSCRCNIPATQCHILFALGESGGTFAQSELVSYLGLEKSWVSRAVEKLAAEDCLEKTRCGSDARCYTLVLTGTGWDRYEKLNGILDDQAAGIMNAIPDNKKAQVRESIALLAAALKKTEHVCTGGKTQFRTGRNQGKSGIQNSLP